MAKAREPGCACLWPQLSWHSVELGKLGPWALGLETELEQMLRYHFCSLEGNQKKDKTFVIQFFL